MRTEYAAYVEPGDIIRHLEHGDLTVNDTEDNGDLIRFVCRDEFAETVRLSVQPFSEVKIVELANE